MIWFSKIISTPLRIVNIPVKVVAKVLDETILGGSGKVADYDPLAIDQIADAVDEAVDE